MTPKPPMTKAEKKAQRRADAKVSRAVRRQGIAGNAHVPGLQSAMQQMAFVRPVERKAYNWYLLALLNPEEYDMSFGIPDVYPSRSHVFRTKVMQSLKFDAAGKWNLQVFPRWKNHFHLLEAQVTRRSLSYATLERYNQFMVPAGTFGGLNHSESWDKVTALVEKNQACSFAMPVGDDVQVAPTNNELVCQDNCATLRSTTSTGSGLTRHWPLEAGATNYVYWTFELNPGLSLTAGDTIRVKVWYTPTLFSFTDFVAVGGEVKGQIVVTIDPAAVTLYHVSWELTVGAATMYLTTLNISMLVDVPDSQNLAVPQDIPGYDTLSQEFSAARCVAMSCLLTYRGDTTKNGKLAGALVDSLALPSHSQLWDYPHVAGLLDSYDGPLITGAYGIWAPMHMRDIDYTPIDKMADYEAPYLTFAGDTIDVDAEEVRIEIYAVWEGLTQETRYNPQPSVVAPHLITDAFKQLSEFPKVQCNPLHLRNIAEFLRSGGKKVSDIVSKVGGFAGLLAPAAMAVNPALGTAMQMAAAAGPVAGGVSRLLDAAGPFAGGLARAM